MEMKELEITIDRDGNVQVSVRGAHGEGCLGLTKNIENAVGIAAERVYTAEFYEQLEIVNDHMCLKR
jgi:hypothetical protein